MSKHWLLCLIFSVLPIASFATEYSENQIYVKFSQSACDLIGTHAVNLQRSEAYQKLCRESGVSRMERLFQANPHHANFPIERYRIATLDGSWPVDDVIDKLTGSAVIEYAEKIPIRAFLLTPNDPHYPGQWHLDQIQAPSAWQLARGDSAVIIAILDSGVDWHHQDLTSEIWINAAEDLDFDGRFTAADLDEFDNDQNGYIDDVIGWDFVHQPGQGYPGEDDQTPDNDPDDGVGHGTHVAGIAAGALHNQLGIAGVGGYCRIMPVRLGVGSYIYNYITGVAYAVENGARIINMSFGGSGFSQFEQEILTEFAQSGVVFVAAAGNDGSASPSYPAAYEHVIAVASVTPHDLKANSSNYGPWITLCAPGEPILSTIRNNGYGELSGTSMASPVVAGAAGLVLSVFPNFTAEAVVHRLCVSADQIDQLNPPYTGLLGCGRLNIYAALDSLFYISHFAVSDTSGDNDGRIESGESGNLELWLKNTTADHQQVTLSVFEDHPDLEISPHQITAGLIHSDDSVLVQIPIALTQTMGFSRANLHLTLVGEGGIHWQQFELPVERPNILIVNDDENNDYFTYYYYANHLETLTTTYEVFHRNQNQLPLVETWHESDGVFWLTGTAETTAMTDNELDLIQEYLNSGGKLFISGQDVAESVSLLPDGGPRLRDVLHCELVADNSLDFDLRTTANPFVETNLATIIMGSGGASNQTDPDVIQATTGALPIIVFDPAQTERQGGIYFAAEETRLMFLSFGFESINDNVTNGLHRFDLLESLLLWFNDQLEIETPIAIPVFSLKQNYPNPFREETTVSYTTTTPGDLNFEIYNVAGQKVWSKKIKNQYSGQHEITWHGLNSNDEHVSNGLYLLKVSINDRNFSRKMIYLK